LKEAKRLAGFCFEKATDVHVSSYDAVSAHDAASAHAATTG